MRQLRPETLGAVVDLAMSKHGVTSGRALSRVAEGLGLGISYTVLNELRRNTYVHPLKREQRERLARLAGVPQRVVDQLAGVEYLAPFALPERAAELRGDQRKAVLAVVNAFIEANDRASVVDAEVVEAAYRPDQPPGSSSDNLP